MRYLIPIALTAITIAGCCCGDIDTSNTSSSRKPKPPPANETAEEKAEREEREQDAADAKAKEESEGDKYEAMVMAEEFVKRHLKWPDNADFHVFGKEAVKTVPIFGKSHWIVRGKVDAVNAFGAELTHRYEVQLFHHEKTWYPRAVELGDEQLFFMDDLLVQAVYAPEMALASVDDGGSESSASPDPDTVVESNPTPPAKPEPPPRIIPQRKKHEPRQWEDATGRFKVTATFVSFGNGVVTIKREDNGEEVKIPLDKLSDTDKDHITTLNR